MRAIKSHYRSTPYSVECSLHYSVMNKAGVSPFCNTPALFLSCRRWFYSRFTIGTKEFNETFNHNPYCHYENTDIYHCQ